jgi:hypothetical protein
MVRLITAGSVALALALTAGCGPSTGQASQALTGDHWVGIVPVQNRCPAGAFKVSFYLDMEDWDKEFSSWQQGFVSFWTERKAVKLSSDGNNVATDGSGKAGTGIDFTWCRVDGELFKPMLTTDFLDNKNAYAVLKLSESCPPNSTDFGIYIDTEDDDPNNSHTGNISPNTVKSNNATLNFCLFNPSVKIAEAMTTFPTLKDDAGANVPYGVLHDFDVAQPTWVLNKRFAFFDDEDNDCETKYLQQPPSPNLTGSGYSNFTSMVERHVVSTSALFGNDYGTFFEFAQVH